MSNNDLTLFTESNGLAGVTYEPSFDGAVYDKHQDKERLTGQIKRIRDLMIDGKWRTLREIEAATGDTSASISAQLRNLKKEKHGGYIYNKRRRENFKGTWEFQILPPNKPAAQMFGAA